ncbi:Putative acetyltransferase [Halomicronema hongdechloris C2206]|uniref:Acetyltransferase n=1 Tax=Halomicronema hongdechloris C2206 TaxID=1641165 RepID=A0A1Z3HSE1_9CYAN|nr:acyltransferase [Halomicronema hongdechloris]ASC73186.1 Putative acetyltransferase [Halomicronema hongdechloris C2206]
MSNIENFSTHEPLTIQKNEEIQKTALQAALIDSKKSALQKYQDFAVGSSKLSALLKYEILTGIFGPIPGALGLVLRKRFYKSLFGSIGRGVVFGKSITIRHPHKIHIGENVIIDDYAVLDAKGTDNQGITIGNNVMIGRNSVISCKNGDITIGDNTNIAMNCFIQSAKTVHIGANVLIAPYCYVIGGGDHETVRTDIPIIAQGQIVKGIIIEDNCWLGADVKVLDGIKIERDSIIGTGAVVTKSLPEFNVAVGIPAKVIKIRKNG